MTLNDMALALQFLGAKVDHNEVAGLVTASHKGVKVRFWLSDKYGVFGVAYLGGKSDPRPYVYSFDQVRQQLGLNGYVRPTTVITRALNHLGLTNRRDENLRRDFYVHGEYNAVKGQLKERVRTLVDFPSKEADALIAERWSEVRTAVSLTGNSFQLHECGGVFHYLSN